MEDIEQAIMHAAQAGKLRAYVRKNGCGLAGLLRLAERHSKVTTGLLDGALVAHSAAGKRSLNGVGSDGVDVWATPR